MASSNVISTENSVLEEEIEALKSIYVRELEVTNVPSCHEYPTRIQLSVYPATADNAHEQYVCLTLIVNVPSTYPDELPEFIIRNPRGLSDDDLEQIYAKLEKTARSNRGTPMLYELCEVAKDHLTSGNTPRCLCAICLYGFSEEDSFVRTDCYHYFHCHCLKRYLAAFAAGTETNSGSTENDKVQCPVCREPVVVVGDPLTDPRPPVYSEAAPDYEPTPLIRRMQRLMATAYERQKSCGGIIDVEADRNRFLLEISTSGGCDTPQTEPRPPPTSRYQHSNNNLKQLTSGSVKKTQHHQPSRTSGNGASRGATGRGRSSNNRARGRGLGNGSSSSSSSSSLPEVGGFTEARQRIVLTGPPPSKSFSNAAPPPLTSSHT